MGWELMSEKGSNSGRQDSKLFAELNKSRFLINKSGHDDNMGNSPRHAGYGVKFSRRKRKTIK
jgi:hypothetical protein